MDRSHLRVMTFNLLTSTKKRRTNPWRLRRRMIARIFREHRPDIVGTQEANYQQLMELAELLPDYEFLGEGNLGPGLAESRRSWWCAIFYRREVLQPIDSENETFWLSPTPRVPASQFHLGTRPRLVTWNTFEHVATGRSLVFGTTHLEAAIGRHRVRSVDLLREHVDRKVDELGEDLPVFLTGDFNAVATSPEIRAMRTARRGQPGLRDVWEHALDVGPYAGATFRGMGLRDRIGNVLLGPRRIDYVFYRPRLQVRSVRRLGFGPLPHAAAAPSDHYPVLAEFQLSP
ncbi:MAG: endonuclease/exonuclease/phosphatase family protein [Candidatus Krumholzibacteriia bacterium]